MNATATATRAVNPPLLGARRKRSRRGLVIATGLAALGVVTWQVAARYPSADTATVYATAPAARADIVSQVTATGTLSPVVTVEVGSQISGRVTELFADYNSVVEAGQVIATIDPQLFESALAQARARLTSAYADHRKAKAVRVNAAAQYDRIAALAAAGAIAEAEADAALATKRSAEASVSAAYSAIVVAKAAVGQAELNLAYTSITSPIDGVVVSRNVDVGQTVAASLSAPVLFVIAEDLRKMEVHTSVAESDVGQLTRGVNVEFTVDAFPNKTYEGTVKQVRYEAATVSNVVTYDAVVAVDNPDLELRPGMTANASFILEARRDVLTVPNKALVYRPAGAARPQRRAGLRGTPDGPRASGAGRGNRRRVWVLRDGEPTMARATVGMSDGSRTEITGGDLREGDLVISGDDSGAATTRPQSPATAQRRGRRGPPTVF